MMSVFALAMSMPDLDDRGRHEHVEPALPEVDHDLFELVLAQLPMRDGDPRLRHEFGESAQRPG